MDGEFIFQRKGKNEDWADVPIEPLSGLKKDEGYYYYGKIKDDGKIELYDKNNDYYYGKLKADGKLEFYDKDNKYYYGKVKADGKLEVYTPKGEYWYGKIKS